jgi:hypothetical protein
MPIKPYRCADCLTERDYLIPPETAPRKCPECGGTEYTPKFTAPSVHSGSARSKAGVLETRYGTHSVTGEKTLLDVTREIRLDRPCGHQIIVSDVRRVDNGKPAILIGTCEKDKE